MTQPDSATQDQNGAAAPAAGEEGGAPGGPDAGGLGSVLYKLALAGVGALILAQEEIEAAWKRARGEHPGGGEEAGDGAQAAPGPTNGDPAHPAPPAADVLDGSRVWLQIDAAIGRVLRSLPIPSREEVDAVSSKLDALAARVEARSRR